VAVAVAVSAETTSAPQEAHAEIGAGISFDDPFATNLAAFYPYANFQRLERGNFTKIKGLANAIHGKVELHRWHRAMEDGVDIPCVVKKMPTVKVNFNCGRETNERRAHRDPMNAPHPEDAYTEIGVFSLLHQQEDRSPFLLKMLGVFQDDENTWLVTEHAGGGELFNKVSISGPMPEEQVVHYMRQLLGALQYLSRHRIGHRDVSLENMLLKDADLRLMDFGQAARTHSPKGTLLRYFRAVGKPYYRPPECCVPRKFNAMQVVAPGASAGTAGRGAGRGVSSAGRGHGHASGGHGGMDGGVTMAQLGGYLCEVRIPQGATPGQTCTAELMGYTVPPVDIFSSGVCMFLLFSGAPPWKNAVLEDPHFAYVHGQGDAGIAALLKAWKKNTLSESAMQLMVRMMRSNPLARPSLQECLSSPWLKDCTVMETEPTPQTTASPSRLSTQKGSLASSVGSSGVAARAASTFTNGSVQPERDASATTFHTAVSEVSESAAGTNS